MTRMDAGEDTVAAVVLAGAENAGKLREVSDEQYEGLVPLAGRPLVQYVVDALRDAKSIDSVLVVGFPPFRDHLDLTGTDLGPAGRSFIDSIAVGLEMNSHADHLLFITGDVPLITGPIIDDFVHRCTESAGELFIPIVRREANEEQFPGVTRTFVRLWEGSFTLGNCFFGTEPGIRRVLPRLRELYEARKNPLRMAMSVGPAFLLRLVTGTCSVPYAERVLHRLTGTTGRAVEFPRAEIALDVDDAEQLRSVGALLRERSPE